MASARGSRQPRCTYLALHELLAGHRLLKEARNASALRLHRLQLLLEHLPLLLQHLPLLVRGRHALRQVVAASPALRVSHILAQCYRQVGGSPELSAVGNLLGLKDAATMSAFAIRARICWGAGGAERVQSEHACKGQ